MLSDLFIAVNTWIAGEGLLLPALGCFLWGMVSVFFSPCHLASIPLIVSYVAGQAEGVRAYRAVWYALAFSSGLFLSIATAGAACAVLGRMLGETGPWWTVLAGAILIWVALDMLGVKACSIRGGLTGRLRVKGIFGAFVLGLAYGLLSGSCTFGFIAPILAIITVQGKITAGVVYILLFALGHCLPIVAAGGSMALVRRLLENSRFQSGSLWFRKCAGAAIACLGAYFILLPFMPFFAGPAPK
jgi:cytochrome c-type biogenesis protein